mgnify:CR=1 FL=1
MAVLTRGIVMRRKPTCVIKTAVTALALALLCASAQAVRIKDLGKLYGPMENPLVGYGLVVGVNGTGDDAKFAPAIRQLSNMLNSLGANNLPVELVGAKNVAIVSVSATLPAYNSIGDRFDVQVAAVGNAKSLAGGRLVVCPLAGPTGELIAIASGDLLVDAALPTTGAIPRGAIVQNAVPTELTPGGKVTFKLLAQNADSSVATLIVQAIHQDMNIDTTTQTPVAVAVDPATIEVRMNDSQLANPVAFISRLERLLVPGLDDAMEARVVIDEKKGTFYAMNGNVEISPVVVGHGNIQIQIQQASGDEATTLNDLVRALAAVNASAADVVGIVKALEDAGALHAKVIRK